MTSSHLNCVHRSRECLSAQLPSSNCSEVKGDLVLGNWRLTAYTTYMTCTFVNWYATQGRKLITCFFHSLVYNTVLPRVCGNERYEKSMHCLFLNSVSQDLFELFSDLRLHNSLECAHLNTREICTLSCLIPQCNEQCYSPPSYCIWFSKRPHLYNSPPKTWNVTLAA